MGAGEDTVRGLALLEADPGAVDRVRMGGKSG
jgi:hypothetical protein